MGSIKVVPKLKIKKLQTQLLCNFTKNSWNRKGIVNVIIHITYVILSKGIKFNESLQLIGLCTMYIVHVLIIDVFDCCHILSFIVYIRTSGLN